MIPIHRRRATRAAYVLVIWLVAACGQPTVQPPVATISAQPSPAGATTAPPTTVAPATVAPAASSAIAKNPSYSSSIAISDDDSLLVVANPLDGSISVFNVASDANTKLAEIKTGDQPRTVAIRPDKRFAYVANEGSATVSVVDLTTLKKVTDVAVGSEPYGVALTPDGSQAFVADSAGDDVAVIDTASNTVSKVILIPGVQPRGIAISNNNGGQGPQLVYVTQFLSQPTATGGPGQDQGSEGKVFIISTATNQAALGKLGYNPTSLLSIFAFPPFLHNGSCPDLACVLENETHFEAGGHAVLSDPASRQALLDFVLSIDGTTKPINP